MSYNFNDYNEKTVLNITNIATAKRGNLSKSAEVKFNVKTTLDTNAAIVTQVKKICHISINVKSIIKLEKFATNIEDTCKEVNITQCTLNPIYAPNKHSKWIKCQLFLAGFVRDTISYVTSTCKVDSVGRCMTDCVRCTTCTIPFNSTIIIKLHGGHYTDYHNNSVNLPYCELMHSAVYQGDLKSNLRDIENYKKLEENMIVTATLKILQDKNLKLVPNFVHIP